MSYTLRVERLLDPRFATMTAGFGGAAFERTPATLSPTLFRMRERGPAPAGAASVLRYFNNALSSFPISAGFRVM